MKEISTLGRLRSTEILLHPELARRNPTRLRCPVLGASARELCENSPMPFCVATCPACSKPFRLRWRIGKRKLELSQVIRLNCPHCRNQFEIEGVELIVFDAGAESFPITAIVDESCLVPWK